MTSACITSMFSFFFSRTHPYGLIAKPSHRPVVPRWWSIVIWNCPSWRHRWRHLQPSWRLMHPCQMWGQRVVARIIILTCRLLCRHNHNNQLQPSPLLLLLLRQHLLCNDIQQWHLPHLRLPPLPPPLWWLAKCRLLFWSVCPPMVCRLARLRLLLAPPLSRRAIPSLAHSSWPMRHRLVTKSTRPRPLIILPAPVAKMPRLSSPC
jgi:hypothetical protein